MNFKTGLSLNGIENVLLILSPRFAISKDG
jgi:hypothetical protein